MEVVYIFQKMGLGFQKVRFFCFGNSVVLFRRCFCYMKRLFQRFSLKDLEK